MHASFSLPLKRLAARPRLASSRLCGLLGLLRFALLLACRCELLPAALQALQDVCLRAPYGRACMTRPLRLGCTCVACPKHVCQVMSECSLDILGTMCALRASAVLTATAKVYLHASASPVMADACRKDECTGCRRLRWASTLCCTGTTAVARSPSSRTLGSALLTMTMWTYSLKARSSCPPSQRLGSFIASHYITVFLSCVQFGNRCSTSHSGAGFVV